MPEKVTYGNNSLTYTGSAFKGKFNGGGHTISNFNLTAAVGKDAVFGFFGMLDGATVNDHQWQDVHLGYRRRLCRNARWRDDQHHCREC